MQKQILSESMKKVFVHSVVIPTPQKYTLIFSLERLKVEMSSLERLVCEHFQRTLKICNSSFKSKHVVVKLSFPLMAVECSSLGGELKLLESRSEAAVAS